MPDNTKQKLIVITDSPSSCVMSKNSNSLEKSK